MKSNSRPRRRGSDIGPPDLEAQVHLSEGHYLLPFQKHFFICDIHYVEALGISRDDIYLKKVGANWVEPQDPKAWNLLYQKIKKHPKSR